MLRGEANARFQSRYRVVLTIACVIAATIHLAGALGAPPYAPTPFQVRSRIPKVVDVIAYEPQSPPPSIPRPIVEVVEGTGGEPDIDIPPNFNIGDASPPPPPTPDNRPFVAWDVPPKLVRSIKPEYPDLARRAEATGEVVLLVTLDDTGRVVDAVVDQSTAIPALEQAALRAVRQWLFTPAKQRDMPVACRILVPFSFSMRGR